MKNLMNDRLKKAITAIQEALNSTEDRLTVIEALRDELHAACPQAAQPVDRVRWVPLEQVEPNNYNPNAVAKKEMSLLYISIKHDGYTQPIVTMYNPKSKKYVIIDGFHRYFICKAQKDIHASNNGLLPIVVINKSLNECMAATIRHNRARGEHTVTGMSSLVFKLLDNGWDDVTICNYLGLEPEELLKLKHITGFSALFKDVEYSKSWETKRMIQHRLKYGKDQSQTQILKKASVK